MPELPEVETVRRALDATIRGRTIARVWLSGLSLREPVAETVPACLAGRRVVALRRIGKYLLIDCDGEVTMLSHLGMSGRWLFFATPPDDAPMSHVHARLTFSDGAAAWYQDARRFGLLRVVATARLAHDPSLAALGPDPVTDVLDPTALRQAARASRTPIKSFLLDQSRIAGIGNIYASEILHRAKIDPRRLAGIVSAAQWARIVDETSTVLGEAIDGMGTTFSMYRTVWGEEGQYGERLRVYGREGDPCATCGRGIRRLVQSGRATYFCTRCQPAGRPPARPPAREPARPAVRAVAARRHL